MVAVVIGGVDGILDVDLVVIVLGTLARGVGGCLGLLQAGLEGAANGALAFLMAFAVGLGAIERAVFGRLVGPANAGCRV